MANKLPWFQWYADDWLSDEKLRACSLEARGLWADMLSLMHKNDRRGYLQIAGKPVTPRQLARMTGCPVDEASRLLAELLDSGVASATDDGIVFSRRMVRDESKRQKCSAAGKKGGGSPNLSGPLKVLPKVLPKVVPKVVPKVASGSGVCVEDSSSEEFFEAHTRNGVGGGVGGEGETFKGQPKGRATDCLNPNFDRFWKAYPNKSAKVAARIAWDKLDPDDMLVSVILSALERQKKSEKWKRGIIPNPDNWLSGCRWDDEVMSSDKLTEAIAERAARERRESEERRRRDAEHAATPEVIKEKLRKAVPGLEGQR